MASMISIPLGLQRIFPMSSQFLHGSGDNYISPEKRESTIITGQTATYKTSLLFQFAVSHATVGSTVAYITHEPFCQIPTHVHGMPQPNPTTARRIKMIYFSNAEDLVTYLASIHQGAAPPEVLIVDDLHHYVCQMQSDGVERALAKLCALVIDTAYFLRSKRQSDDVHNLLVGTQSTCTEHLQIVQRFFRTVYNIKETTPDDGSESYYQMAAPGPSVPERADPTITFRIQNDQIYLKNVIS